MLNIDDEKPDIRVAENVTPLRQGHAWRAAGAWSEASAVDPLMRYLHNDQKQTHVVKFATKALMSVLISLWIPKKISLTIGSGGTFIVAQPGVVESEPKGPIDRVITWLTNEITSVLIGKLGHAEQRKRNKEYETKLQDAIHKTIGARVKDMVKVIVLETESESQGKNYSGALLDSVTSLADLMGQATMVQCSDLQKSEFYNAHGFKSVANVVLGDENPKWHDVPVTIKIMIREPARGE